MLRESGTLSYLHISRDARVIIGSNEEEVATMVIRKSYPADRGDMQLSHYEWFVIDNSSIYLGARGFHTRGNYALGCWLRRRIAVIPPLFR